MFEEVNAPLPDKDAYLDRIHYKHEACSKEALDDLILAHQTSVPFEDLDPWYLKKPVSVATEDLFDKIVVRKRGGYCFELNAAFTSLLQALGYDAYSGFCRIVRDRELTDEIPVLHRVNFVRFDDGLYVCDVGYGGPMPSFALKVEDGFEKTKNGETFYIRHHEEEWWVIGRVDSKGAREDVMLVSTKRQYNSDFMVLSHYTCTSDRSPFTKIALFNLRTKEGNVSITGDTFSERKNGVVTECKIKDDAHLLELLETYFEIQI